LIAFILKDLGSDVRRRATLLKHSLSRSVNLLGNTKVTNFNSALRREQYVIKLDVAVQDLPRVTIHQSFNYLPENVAGDILFYPAAFADISEQVTTAAHFHDQYDMLRSLK
jgi:hypothetical protein